MKPLWTIGVLTIPQRAHMLAELVPYLESLIGAHPVELLIDPDYPTPSIGEKCNRMLARAQGDFLSFVADDDWVEPQYVTRILPYLTDDVDVVSFQIDAPVPNQPHVIVTYGLDQARGQVLPLPINVWRVDVASRVRFPDISFGEDFTWVVQVVGFTDWSRWRLIPEVLYHYREHGPR